MKNIIYLFLIAVTFLFSSSCNDILTDVQPTDNLSIEVVFSSGADLEAAMIGAYDGLQHGQLMGRNIPSLADLMAFNGVGYFEEVTTLQMEADHSIPLEIWTQGYKIINQVNAILEALPEISSKDATMTTEQANKLEGEALFIRAVIHFELVRLYALPFNLSNSPGVPLMTAAILKKENLQFPARASVEEVYRQVKLDLERAKDLLPESSDPWKINQLTVLAYLARVNFQQGAYEAAKSWSRKIVDSDRYSLTNSPEEFYDPEGSDEEIWIIPSTSGDEIEDFGLASVYNDAPTTAAISVDLRENGYTAIVPDFQILNIQNTDPNWQVVDLRCDPNGLLSNHLLVLNDATGDTTRCNKYEQTWLAEEDDTPNARLAEFILMLAESLVHTEGLNEESIALLNQIRKRSLRVINESGEQIENSDSFIEFEMADFPNGEALIEAIVLERRVELAFEGNYLHDLMRLKRAVINGLNIYLYDADELRLPIPQREIDANPNLVQNKGY